MKTSMLLIAALFVVTACTSKDDLKKLIKDYIDCEWDHKTIINKLDKDYLEQMDAAGLMFWCLIKGNPTAENMAAHLWVRIEEFLGQEEQLKDLRLKKIELYETDDSKAVIEI
jgi:6-pyruvoyl-tetrahydropterin synthase